MATGKTEYLSKITSPINLDAMPESLTAIRRKWYKSAGSVGSAQCFWIQYDSTGIDWVIMLQVSESMNPPRSTADLYFMDRDTLQYYEEVPDEVANASLAALPYGDRFLGLSRTQWMYVGGGTMLAAGAIMIARKQRWI